VGGRKR